LRALPVLVLALVAMALEAGSLPHLHIAGGSALFNHDHDLAYLATLNGSGSLPAAAVIVPWTPRVRRILAAPRPRPSSTPHRQADSRAPPAPTLP
jgi:hypothetical protein